MEFGENGSRFRANIPTLASRRWGTRQKGSADHRCRDREDFLVRKRYIEENPVVAGMVGLAEDFKWSSASRFLRGLGE